MPSSFFHTQVRSLTCNVSQAGQVALPKWMNFRKSSKVGSLLAKADADFFRLEKAVLGVFFARIDFAAKLSTFAYSMSYIFGKL